MCDTEWMIGLVGLVGALIGAGAALVGVHWQLAHASKEALRQRRVDLYVRLGSSVADTIAFGIQPAPQRELLKPKVVHTLSELGKSLQEVMLVGGREVRVKAHTMYDMIQPLLGEAVPDDARQLEEVIALLKQAKRELDGAMRAEITG